MTQIERIIQGLQIIQLTDPDATIDAQDGIITAGDYEFGYNEMEQWQFDRMVWQFDRMVRLGWDQTNGRWSYTTKGHT